MKREQLIPLLPEIKEVLTYIKPDTPLFGKLSHDTEGRHMIMLYDSEEKTKSKDVMPEYLIIEVKEDSWMAFYRGITDFGKVDGNPSATYGMIPHGGMFGSPVDAAEGIADNLIM